MRSARSWGVTCPRGVPARGWGVYLPGGVPSRRGCTCQGKGGMYLPGVYLPRGCTYLGGCTFRGVLPRYSPLDRILDTHYWKYYLAPTSLQSVKMRPSDHQVTRPKNSSPIPDTMSSQSHPFPYLSMSEVLISISRLNEPGVSGYFPRVPFSYLPDISRGVTERVWPVSPWVSYITNYNV